MANRFPLIFNSGAGQIQELAASDNLDLTSSNLVNAGILSTSSGSVTAPSLQIGSGTTYNPGLYSPGTDQLAVATNGTGRLFVDASGNIGVGVSSPQHPVHIDGTSGSVQFRAGVTYAGTGLDIKATENNDVTIDVNDSTKTVARALVVSQAGSERLRITAGGLVGIGTGSVNTKLEIAGNNDAVTENNTLRFTDTDANTEANQQIGKIEFYSSDASTPGAGVKAYIGAFAADTTPDAYLAFATQDGSVVSTPVERVRITSDGKLGIGVTGPTQKLQVTDGTLSNFYVAPGYNSGSGTLLATGGSEYLAFATNGLTNERARIDSSGRLLIGTSTSRSVQDFAGNGPESLIQIEAANSTAIMSIISAGTADASRGGTLSLGRHRNATVGATPTVVQSGDLLGAICFAGGDGTDMLTKGASIACQVDGTPGADDMPGRLVFSTTADGGSSPTEQMRIGNQGTVFFGTTAEVPSTANVVGATFYRREGLLSITRDGGEALSVNRKTSDGNLVVFHQDGTVEGTITVSGTTVSYNGAHLSRWSQLPSGVERTEILRGSVLSNIDEMCKWGEEENEQLNRMKVSDVEGDKNVSGVFQAWDDDDDTYTNDFYCAMTGDFIIRIAEGTTVERGDLLMSAGDGTAKPQDDDIIRSKTVAKVTSTNVTCTYEDGSYCVPCVLMAC